MERGFDKLMTPEGIALVTAAGFFLLAFIVMGGTLARLSAREKSRRQKPREEE
ncbi:MAG TPA: hypothetical protein VGE01_04890 [Fimbriimonas sp.]